MEPDAMPMDELRDPTVMWGKKVRKKPTDDDWCATVIKEDVNELSAEPTGSKDPAVLGVTWKALNSDFGAAGECEEKQHRSYRPPLGEAVGSPAYRPRDVPDQLEVECVRSPLGEVNTVNHEMTRVQYTPHATSMRSACG